MSSDYDFSFQVIELDRLRGELGTLTAISLRQQADLTHLRAINAALVEALLHIKFGYTLAPASKEMVDAAIAKAKGEQT